MQNSDKGSRVLREWNAQRQAEKGGAVSNAQLPLSSGTYGSELYELLTGNAQTNGVVVNERTAMCVGAVSACVALIGGAIASLPAELYERLAKGRTRIDVTKSHAAARIWWLLNEQPHPRLCAAVFWEYLAASILLHGDGFAQIIRGPGRHSPEIDSFLPLHPMNVQVLDDPVDPKRLLYHVWNNITGKIDVIGQDDMLHIPGAGFDGYRGMSQIQAGAKRAISIALSADIYQENFFKNGARPDFALLSEKKLDVDQANVLRTTWGERHGGVQRSHLPAILTGGLKIEKLSMSAQDIQIAETRKLQAIDVARIFGVPPHMIGETEKASSWGQGIENLGLGFVKYTLNRHLVKIQQELNRKIFPTSLRWIAEFDTKGLMRGDAKSRADYNTKALGGNNGPGWLTKNEVRIDEGREPLEGGDTLIEWKQGPATAPSKSTEEEDDDAKSAAAA